jgi:transcriptional regulator with XRE-family HTH domain
MTSRYDRIMKTFAKRLKVARIKGGYKSAQAFANAAGFDPHAYRKYERGEVEANYETLIRICELLKITPNELLPVSIAEVKQPGRPVAA